MRILCARGSYIAAFVLVLVVVMRLAFGPFGDSLLADKAGSTTPQQQSGLITTKPPAQINKKDSVIPVRVEDFEAQQYQPSLVFRGQTEAKRKVTLKTETSGAIVELPVEKGTLVVQGATVVRLEDNNKPALLEEARALLAQRELEYEAASKLTRDGYTPEVTLAESKANLESAKANLAQRELDLSHTAIKAPFTAFLDELPAEKGDFLSVGDSIAELVDLSSILISAQVNEKLVSQIKVGDEVEVALSTGQEARGRIIYISAQAEANTRTFRVEAEAPNPDFAIVDGLTAEMTVHLAPESAHLLSPALLTIDDTGEVGVYAMDANSIAHFLPVTIIDSTTNGIWVTGVPEQVKLIVVGQEFITEGQKLKAVEAGTLRAIPALAVNQQS